MRRFVLALIAVVIAIAIAIGLPTGAGAQSKPGYEGCYLLGTAQAWAVYRARSATMIAEYEVRAWHDFRKVRKQLPYNTFHAYIGELPDYPADAMTEWCWDHFQHRFAIGYRLGRSSR